MLQMSADCYLRDSFSGNGLSVSSFLWIYCLYIERHCSYVQNVIATESAAWNKSKEKIIVSTTDSSFIFG